MRGRDAGALLLLLLACGEEGGGTVSIASSGTGQEAQEASTETVRVSVRIEAEMEALLFGAGRVTEVLVEEGDSVAAGQILVRLSGDRTAAAFVSAQVQELEAARILALNSEREYERCTSLHQAGALSAAQLEGAQTAMIASREALLAAQAEVSGALSGLEASTLQAPFDGWVGRIWAREGNLSGAEPLLMLTGGEGLIAHALLPEREIGSIESGGSATFRTTVLPDRVFDGTVTSVAVSLDPVTSLLPVTVRISDPEGLLAPGLYGTLELGSHLKTNSYEL